MQHNKYIAIPYNNIRIHYQEYTHIVNIHNIYGGILFHKHEHIRTTTHKT